MIKEKKRENITYLLIWLAVFMVPPIMSVFKSLTRAEDTFSILEVARGWLSILPFLALFLLHNYLICPAFFNRRKMWAYILLTALSLVLFSWAIFKINPHPGPPDGRRQGPPPPEVRASMEEKPMGAPLDPNVILVIVGVLMVISNVGAKEYFKGRVNDERLEELEKENLHQQMQYLRYQFNPHFFMNTLNNIHALVDIDPEQAKGSIVDLSKLLRYILYEGDKPTIPLSKETEFLENYVSLMKVRYSDEVKVSLDLPSSTGDVEIPPLLFVSFVENAFKHGISYEKPSFIDVRMNIGEDGLEFDCRNSRHPVLSDGIKGIGMENIRKRLDLIYGKDYTLDVNSDDSNYEVRLKIPIAQQ